MEWLFYEDPQKLFAYKGDLNHQIATSLLDDDNHNGAATTDNNSDIQLLAIAPLIYSESSRKKWETYSKFVAEKENETSIRKGGGSMKMNDNIFKFEVDEQKNGFIKQKKQVTEVGPGPYAPIWQVSLSNSLLGNSDNKSHNNNTSNSPATSTAMIQTIEDLINFNLLSHPTMARLYSQVQISKQPVLSQAIDIYELFNIGTSSNGNKDLTHSQIPHSIIVHPIFDGFSSSSLHKNNDHNDDDNDDREIIGIIVAVVSWESIFDKILSNVQGSVVAVLEDSCNYNDSAEEQNGSKSFTAYVNGGKPTFCSGDCHNYVFNYFDVSTKFGPFLGSNVNVIIHNNNIDHVDTNDDETSSPSSVCGYTLRLYPSNSLYTYYDTSTPKRIALLLTLIFIVTCAVFKLYDFIAQMREIKVHKSMANTNIIISQLFPREVREQLFEEQDEVLDIEAGGNEDSIHGTNNNGNCDSKILEERKRVKKLFNYYNNCENVLHNHDGKPMAKFYAESTVMFADIAGFTAWSSEREPEQVFTLLERIYGTFDMMAKSRRVFKVETIGDCYIAVTGVPNPQKDHAIRMCKFANDCLKKVKSLTLELERTLGPGTSNLDFRVGIHSGPVTAGLLRGEKSRFELFGYSVDTVTWVEANGKKGHIHLSEDTAALLIASGKSHWVRVRDDNELERKTYWLCSTKAKIPKAHNNECCGESLASFDSSSISDFMCGSNSETSRYSEKLSGLDDMAAKDSDLERLVSWNTEVLVYYLKQIIARRGEGSNLTTTTINKSTCSNDNQPNSLMEIENEMCRQSAALQEVQEIIRFPSNNNNKNDILNNVIDGTMVHLDHVIVSELRDYIRLIANMHRGDNPFHNFEHTCHVVMSANKLISRVIARYNEDVEQNLTDSSNVVFDCTYGIACDPLTQFAVVLSALIHDVDHRGVDTLLQNNNSRSEQHAVDVAWMLLMEGRFSNLRKCIYSNEIELRHFRQIIMNCVLSTDDSNGEILKLRSKRWETSIVNASNSNTDNERLGCLKSYSQDDNNRNATIIVDHLMQISYASHAMQHWNIYSDWSIKKYEEAYKTYQNVYCGEDDQRDEKNVLTDLYNNELRFFDDYVIPLVKRMRVCKVFGSSNDEYYHQVIENRSEWASKGKYIVASILGN